MSTWNLGLGAGLQSGGSWALTGGALPTILADGSDATFVKKAFFDVSQQKFGTVPGTWTRPTNEVFRQFRWRARMSRPAGSSCTARWRYSVLGVETYVGAQSFTGVQAAATLVGSWLTTDPSTYGAALGVQIADLSTGAATQITLMELGWDVNAASIPVAPTITAPSGTLTDTSAPAVTWTHSDLLSAAVTNKALTSNVVTLTTAAAHNFQVGNDVTVALTTPDAVFDGTYKITAVTATTFSYARTNANVGSVAAPGTATIGEGLNQDGYQVRIFTTAQFSIGGFDPSTSPATYDSGQVTSSAATITPPSLANTGYRAYVRTAKSVNGTLQFGAWAFSAFTLTVVPAAVSLSASFDSANNRVQLTIAGNGNMLAAQDANPEVAANIGSWTAGANTTVTQSTTFADSGTGSIRLASVAAGNVQATTGAGLAGRLVIVGVTYSASVRLRSAISRSSSIGIVWYDSAGGVLSTSAGSAAASSAAGFTTYTVTAAAPASAVYGAVVVVVIGAAGAGEFHYVDSIALHPGSTPAYSPGGMTYTALVTRTPSGGSATVVRPTVVLDAAQRATYYDYECPRAVSTTYSFTLVGAATGGGVSSAAATAAVTATNDGTWWIKAVDNSALNRGAVRVLQEPTESREENLGVFRIDGRPDAVIVAGQTFGDDPDFQIYTSTAAEFEAIKALVVRQGTLLLQEPFTDSAGIGLQRYIRVVDRSWTKAGVPTAPRRVFSIRSVETGKGY